MKILGHKYAWKEYLVQTNAVDSNDLMCLFAV